MGIVNIINTKQAMLYIKHGIKPLDIYADNNKLIYVFSKDQTKELFNKWCKYELK